VKKIWKSIEVVIALGILVVLILWLGGFLSGDRMEPGQVEVAAWEPEIIETVRAERISVPLIEEAVGTLRPVTEAMISAQITGRILSIEVRAGDRVQAGQPLVRLDNRELQAQVDQALRQVEMTQAVARQAREGLNGATAQLEQAKSQYERVKKFHEQQAATTQQLEEAESAYRQAEAGVKQAQQRIQAADADVERAREAVRQAQVASGYASITAPTSGEVSQRLAEPGDLAYPGKPILAIQSEGALRLEANVRESLFKLVPVGTSVQVDIPAVQHTVNGTIDEVVPSADVVSRSFLVKVRLDSAADLYPGMYGKLLIPAGQYETVVAPAKSIQRVGQLETVLVRTNERWERRYVRTGFEKDEQVEILSGLDGNEELGVAGGQQS